MKIKGDSIIVNAIKLAENGEGIVIRLNNPTDKSVCGEIKLMNTIGEAFMVNMNEEILDLVIFDTRKTGEKE